MFGECPKKVVSVNRTILTHVNGHPISRTDTYQKCKKSDKRTLLITWTVLFMKLLARGGYPCKRVWTRTLGGGPEFLDTPYVRFANKESQGIARTPQGLSVPIWLQVQTCSL